MPSKWKEDRYNRPPIPSLGDKVPIIIQQARPSINNPSDWAVMLVSKEYNHDEEDLEHEIARIDNWHNGPHIHRYFEGDNVKENLPHDFSLDDAREYLDDNREDFMERFYSN